MREKLDGALPRSGEQRGIDFDCGVWRGVCPFDEFRETEVGVLASVSWVLVDVDYVLGRSGQNSKELSRWWRGEGERAEEGAYCNNRLGESRSYQERCDVRFLEFVFHGGWDYCG